ncbi:hypothetical protein THAOC_25219, partial [Thalassiosira oceanica]
LVQGHATASSADPEDQEDKANVFMDEVAMNQWLVDTSRQALASLEGRRAQPGERGWNHWDQCILDLARQHVDSLEGKHGSSGE